MGNRVTYDFAATMEHDTPKAYLLDCGGKEPQWFPKSQTTDNGDGSWTVPEWLAKEKGIV